MVGKTVCPNCGQQMDVSNIFISGKADCPHCGYSGLPLGESEHFKKIREKSEEIASLEAHDPLDIRSLVGKLAIIMAGVLVMSVFMPEMRTFLPVSVLGMLLFAASYKFLEK